MFTYSTVPSRLSSRADALTSGVAVVIDALGTLVVRALEWQDRARQRQALGALDDHLLKDIGLSRAGAEREFRKRSWRP